MKKPMKIYIKIIEGQTFPLHITESETITKLKQKIQQIKKIPIQQQALIFAGKYLLDQQQLCEFNIQKQTTVQLFVIKQSGRSNKYDHKSQITGTGQNLNGKAPKYRNVCSGLNLQAECQTLTCEAYGKAVWVMKKFGSFNVAKEVYRCKCPICGQITKPAFNIGYRNTYIKVQGKQMNSENEIQWEQKITNDVGLITFVDGNEDMEIWNFLEITTTKLDVSKL